MTSLRITAINAFVPARDLEQSRRFYLDLGFTQTWGDSGGCGLQLDGHSMILQRFHVKEHAENFMMQLMVEDVDAWWEKIQALNLKEKYQLTMVKAPAMQPWGLRILYISDPSGVLWHVAEVPGKQA